jgi:hypothetical protein
MLFIVNMCKMVIRKTYVPLSIVVVCVRVRIIIPVVPALFVGLGLLLAPMNSPRIRDLPFYWSIIAVMVDMTLSFLFKGNH